MGPCVRRDDLLRARAMPRSHRRRVRKRFAPPARRLHSVRRDSIGVATPFTKFRGTVPMKPSSAIRVALLALTAFAGAVVSSAARADEGFVALTIYKAGWIIGGSGGGGMLNFHGRSYPLSAGGLDYGLVFGGSKTEPRGGVSHISRPSDVAG